MEDWQSIAAEVEGALRSVADVSQPEGYPVTIRRRAAADPYDPDDTGTTTYHEFVAVDSVREIRDIDGRLTGETKRTLMVNATGATAPGQGDTVAVGVAAADAAAYSGPWVEVMAVRPLAPTGIAVLYELDLAI